MSQLACAHFLLCLLFICLAAAPRRVHGCTCLFVQLSKDMLMCSVCHDTVPAYFRLYVWVIPAYEALSDCCCRCASGMHGYDMLCMTCCVFKLVQVHVTEQKRAQALGASTISIISSHEQRSNRQDTKHSVRAGNIYDDPHKGMLARQAAQQSQLMLRRLSQRTASTSCAPVRLAALCAAQLKQMPLRARQCSTWDGALVANVGN